MTKYAIVLILMVGSAWAQASKPSAGTPMHHSSPEAVQSPRLMASLAPSRTAGKTVSLPVGTAIYMKLETALTTTRSVPGDAFAGRISYPVRAGQEMVIPEGSTIEGRVVRVSEPRRVRGKPTIQLRPDMVVLPNGNRMPIRAVVVDTSLYPFIDVDEEGRIQGRGRDANDWKETGIGAGGGALIGGLVAGGPGVLYGAGIGAAASLVHWLSMRRSAELPAGTEIILELSRPLTTGSEAAF